MFDQTVRTTMSNSKDGVKGKKHSTTFKGQGLSFCLHSLSRLICLNPLSDTQHGHMFLHVIKCDHSVDRAFTKSLENHLKHLIPLTEDLLTFLAVGF